MISLLKKKFRKIRETSQRFQFYYSVNWTKTLYFNFKKFPYSTAKKLPVFFYGKVKFTSIKGVVKIDSVLKRGMIGFGQSYETNTIHKGFAEIIIDGTLVFKGHVQFGKDYLIKIGKNGYLEMGNMSSLGSNGKIICMDKVILGNYARIGFESQIIDTNAHQMFDTLTGEKYPLTNSINIGNYNYISNRVSIMKNTLTPNFCSVASNSLCNKDYSLMGENILIGGIPAKLIRNNISRNWDNEIESIDKWLIV